ncbi:hypothetical protein ACMT9Y_03320 [Clavibacter tessellarius]|uniref:hypothetical protein n=1 Tax=Clavibacter tessellarius TaxID=31965 RepID=UPI0039E9CF69
MAYDPALSVPRESAPGPLEADRVVIWNADENRPTLAMNDALGFEHGGTSGSWLRDDDGVR